MQFSLYLEFCKKKCLSCLNFETFLRVHARCFPTKLHTDEFFCSTFLYRTAAAAAGLETPTKTHSIWAARKRRKAGAGTQNLRHRDKSGSAGVAQACAGRRRGGASPSIYMKEACLFVCSDLEPKVLDGFQPNLAWSTPWALWVASKYFFGLTPPGGEYNVRKNQKSKLSPHGQDGGRNPFVVRTFGGTLCATLSSQEKKYSKSGFFWRGNVGYF